MTVDKISGNMISNNSFKPASVGNAERRSAEKSSAAKKSQAVRVDTSGVAKMMSRSSHDLAELHKLRPDVVAKYRERSVDVSDISDAAIDQIFDRMLI